MATKPMTYASAGVSIRRGDQFVAQIGRHIRSTSRPEVLGGLGGFSAVSRLPGGIRQPRLVVSTDGVGTKVLLARQLGRYDTVGIDLVAMCVNDILTTGAEPLLFLDYYATGKIEPKIGSKLVQGIASGCRKAGCALVGGETAEMPQVYRPGDFDLAGFGVGVVEANRLVTGKKVRKGDAVMGIPSSGVHSNGYSLVRAIVARRKNSLKSRPKWLKGKTLGEAFLQPTRIYVKEILKLMRQVDVLAMAHITGGGIEGNLPRVFPPKFQAEIDRKSWRIPPIYSFLQEQGRVATAEMFQTFNMGIGFVLICRSSDVGRVRRSIKGARQIGEISLRPRSTHPSVRFVD